MFLGETVFRETFTIYLKGFCSLVGRTRYLNMKSLCPFLKDERYILSYLK